MHAYLISPGQDSQQLTLQQLTALAPKPHNDGTQPEYLTVNTEAAAQILGVDAALVDVLYSNWRHVVLCIFDSTAARNKVAEQACLRIGIADYIGDDDGDAGHLFGSFLIVDAYAY